MANNAKSVLVRKGVQDQSSNIIEIFPRIYWMQFPRAEIINEMAHDVKNAFKGKHFIWNVSEYQYDREPFDNQVLLQNILNQMKN